MNTILTNAKLTFLSNFHFTEDEELVESMRHRLINAAENNIFKAVRSGELNALLTWLQIYYNTTKLLGHNRVNRLNWNLLDFKIAFRTDKTDTIPDEVLHDLLNKVYSNNLGLLHTATDPNLTKWLIQHGASPNLRTNNTNVQYSIGGKTPLHTAHNLDIIKILLENGANINVTDEAGRTPLWYHSFENFSVDCINFFLDKGADINITKSDGKNLLYLFTWTHPDLNIQKKLLTQRHSGINVNIKNSDHRTPLHEAVRSNNLELVNLLISNGANPDVYDNNHLTPLLESVITKKSNEIQCALIEHGADVNATDEYGRTPLFYVSASEPTRLMLKHNADIFIQDKTDKNMLYFIRDKSVINTIKQISPDALKELSNQPNRYNETPLHWAIDSDVIDTLILSGANVNAQNNRGITPLHWAATPEIAVALIRNGANVNATNDRGATPLHWTEDPKIAQILIDNCANTNACDEDGETPLDYAIANKNHDMVNFLRAHQD